MKAQPHMRGPKSWLRFSLRTCVIVVSVLIVALAVFVNQVKRQERAIQHFLSVGGRVIVEHEVDSNGSATTVPKLHGPQWLRKAIGDEYFKSVDRLELSETKITDSDLKYLSALSEMRFLDLSFTSITDESVGSILACDSLETVDIVGTKITEDGAQALKDGGKQVICMLNLKIAVLDSSGTPLDTIKSETPVLVRATYRVPKGMTPNYRPLIFQINAAVPNVGDVTYQSGIPKSAKTGPEQYTAEMTLTVHGIEKEYAAWAEVRWGSQMAKCDARIVP